MQLIPSELTRADVLLILQNANCCASKKLVRWINTQCEQDFEDAELMWDLIDSIVTFVPEGDTISGDQACYTAASVIQLSPANVTITLGSIIYPATSLVPSSATTVAAYINSFYPQSYSYTATASGNDLEICGTDYDANNGDVVLITIQKGLTIQTFSDVLSGGTAQVLQGENCLTNEEVILILQKLISMSCCCS